MSQKEDEREKRQRQDQKEAAELEKWRKQKFGDKRRPSTVK